MINSRDERSCLPLPLRERSNCEAIRVRGYGPSIDLNPSPQPSPTRGEGAHCHCRNIVAPTKVDCFVASAPVRKRFAFVAGNDVETTIRIPAARMHPDFAEVSALFNRGRRECRALDAPAASHAVCETKHTSVVTTVTPESPGIPRAMVLRLPSCSPRRTKPASHRRHRHWVSRTTRLLRPRQHARPAHQPASIASRSQRP